MSQEPAVPTPKSGGRLTIFAKVLCHPGKAQRCLELLQAVKTNDVPKEPGTLVYHVGFSLNAARADELFVFEVYADQESLDSHTLCQGIQDLIKVDEEEKLIAEEDIQYFEDL